MAKCPTCKTRDPATGWFATWRCLWCDYVICNMPVAGLDVTCYVRHIEKAHGDKYR